MDIHIHTHAQRHSLVYVNIFKVLRLWKQKNNELLFFYDYDSESTALFLPSLFLEISLFSRGWKVKILLHQLLFLLTVCNPSWSPSHPAPSSPNHSYNLCLPSEGWLSCTVLFNFLMAFCFISKTSYHSSVCVSCLQICRMWCSGCFFHVRYTLK